MSTVNQTTAIAIFESRAQAENAVTELRESGFPDDQIGVVTRDGVVHEPGRASQEGAGNMASGAGIGMLVGASLGGLAVGAGAGPGAPFVAGGLLAGLLGGGVTGGLIGALIGLGIPEEEARYYEDQLEAGRTIVTVNAPDRYSDAEDILARHGGRPSSSPLNQSGVGNLP